jgi:hypothetical protein
LANTLGAVHQGHQFFKNHHLGGIPGVSLVEARGIPWGFPAGSCGSLLGDLIRKRRSAWHFYEGREGVMSSCDEPSLQVSLNGNVFLVWV